MPSQKNALQHLQTTSKNMPTKYPVIFSYRLVISGYTYRQKTHILYKLTLIHMYTQVLFRLSIKGSDMLIDNSSDSQNLSSKAFLGTLNSSVSAMNLTASLLSASQASSPLTVPQKVAGTASYVAGTLDRHYFIQKKIILYLCTSHFNRIFQVSLLSNSILFFHKDQ